MQPTATRGTVILERAQDRERRPTEVYFDGYEVEETDYGRALDVAGRPYSLVVRALDTDGRPLVDDYVRTITVSEESEAVVPSVATYYARWQFLVPAIISSVAATVAFGIAGEEAAYGGGVSEVLLGVGGAFGGAGLVLFVPSFLPRSGWDLKPLKASR